MVDDNIDFLVCKTSDGISKALNAEKEIISLEAIRIVKDSLGINKEPTSLKELIKKKTSSLLGVEDVVRKVVDIFIDEKAPILIQNGQDKIEAIFLEIMEDFGDAEVHNFSLKLDKTNLLQCIESTLKADKISTGFAHVADKIIDKILDENIIFYLEKVDVHNFLDIADLFKNELNTVFESIENEVNIQEDKIYLELSNLGTTIIDKEILEKNLNYFLGEISKKDLEIIIKTIFNNVSTSKSLDKNIAKYIKAFEEKTKQSTLQEFIDDEKLKEIIISILENDQLSDKLQKSN